MNRLAWDNTATVQLVVKTCGNCGIVFAVPESFEDECLKHEHGWHCPNGHGRHYIHETEAQKMKRLYKMERATAERLRMERDAAERSRAATRGVLTKVKKRVANGVCPCCNRSFQDLARHMQNQHPEYPNS